MRRPLQLFSPFIAVLRFWYDAVMVVLRSPTGRLTLIRRMLVVTVVETAAIWVGALIVPGVSISGQWTAVIASIVIAFLGSSVRPALVYVVLPFVVLTFGLLSLAVNAVLLLLTAELVDGFEVSGFGWAILAGFVISAVSIALSAVFNIREEESFYRHVFARSQRRLRTYRDSSGRSKGMLMIQIDGLSHEVLLFAIRGGLMPTVARWVSRDTHSISPWECALPSQTSASQAGILHGNNTNIPAFRWYDKDQLRVVVSNRPKDAALIESRASALGPGLLGGGSSISNLVSGSAKENTLTLSALSNPRTVRSSDFASYFLNPYNFTRAIVLMFREMVIEWWQARRQSILGVEPRVKRGGWFPLLRAVTCVLLRDITTSAVIDDMSAGVPVIYCNYVGYDEIAHHAGPEREEALAELRNIDRQIAVIEHLGREAPRDYDIILLSDHGQSQGATFQQRYGMSLSETVRSFVSADSVVIDSSGTSEDWGHLNALLNEVAALVTGLPRWLARLILGRSAGDTPIELGPDRQIETEQSTDIVVSASGNLGLLHFAGIKGRATCEVIEARHPDLIRQLANHEGIGFIMVRSESKGLLAIGKNGESNLSTGQIVGEDPLAPFGNTAIDKLIRLDTFSNVGDVVIVSRIDAETDEVAAFEELVGSHGGVGGLQTSAFVLHPDALTVNTPIRGAEELHRVLSGWKHELLA